MKKWAIIDDCTSSKSAIFETVVNAVNRSDAISIAMREWMHMSSFDRKKCDAFYVGFADLESDGSVDLGTMIDIYCIK